MNLFWGFAPSPRHLVSLCFAVGPSILRLRLRGPSRQFSSSAALQCSSAPQTETATSEFVCFKPGWSVSCCLSGCSTFCWVLFHKAAAANTFDLMCKRRADNNTLSLVPRFALRFSDFPGAVCCRRLIAAMVQITIGSRSAKSRSVCHFNCNWKLSPLAKRKFILMGKLFWPL